MSLSNTEPFNIDALEFYINTAMAQWHIPGLAIAIVKDGNTVLCKGYGKRDINKKLPVDEHTLFAIAATTASFTAAALALLVAEGKMNWHDRLVDLLPGFKTADDEVTQKATAIDALTNRSGLSGEGLSFWPHAELSRAEMISKIRHIPFVAPFRSEYGACTPLVAAVGELIPALAGMSWDDFVCERLFKPLRMIDSITAPNKLTDNHNVVTPHEIIKGTMTTVSHCQTSNVGPAMSIYSSAADMAEWLKFQLNNGKVGDRVILPAEQIPPLRASYMGCNFDFPGIVKNFVSQGLGLLISDSTSGHKLYSYGGDVEGMESYHAFVPEINLGVAVMVNSTQVMPQPLVAWVIDRYTSAPERDWVEEILPLYMDHAVSALSDQKQQQQTITDTSKIPSYPFAKYAGFFRNPLLGDLNIVAKSDHLAFRLGTGYFGELHHANHDTFFIQMNEPHMGKYLFYGPVQFQLDIEGKVNRLVAMDNVFQRVDKQSSRQA